jgi:hypothetical protein
MAQNKIRTVPTFRAPSAYEEEMMRAQRQQQLAEMLRQYCDLMHSNDPVHTWPTD